MTVEEIEKCRCLCLEYIKTYLKFGHDDTRLFRTLAANWYAYFMGPQFLKPTGKNEGQAEWFNNPTNMFKPKHKSRVIKALRDMDFVSEKALAVIHKAEQDNELQDEDRLAVDHVVPNRVLAEKLRIESNRAAKNGPLSDDQIENFLCKYYRLGVITKMEHDQIGDKKKNGGKNFCDKMPDGWDNDPIKPKLFARYENAVPEIKPATGYPRLRTPV